MVDHICCPSLRIGLKKKRRKKVHQFWYLPVESAQSVTDKIILAAGAACDTKQLVILSALDNYFAMESKQ